MQERDARAFAQLFRDAYRKCFGTAFTAPLTESESHHLSVEISEGTGHEIGWKSLKNYSQYLLGMPQAKLENPSIPTLDALARYVAGAAASGGGDVPTSQGKRHYGHWFRYKEAFPQPRWSALPRRWIALVAALLGAAMLVVLFTAFPRGDRIAGGPFSDEFDDVTDSALTAREWSVLSIDSSHWAPPVRGSRPGHITLFTLAGDNWPQPGVVARIRNLLVRRAPSGCFVAELRLSDFVPGRNWQQAGLVLLEDTAFAAKSVRVSLGYNDFAGGFPGTKEIIIQGVTSLGRDFPKPEEIAHERLFVAEPGSATLIAHNLDGAALRIEKLGTRVRLLYSIGPMRNAPFKEAASREFEIRPAYVGIFAIKGVGSRADDMPVYVDAFAMRPAPCAR